MYSEIDTDKLTSAGRFLLDDITLVSYQSADGSNKNAKSVSIKSLVQEINLYESLEGPGLSGNVVVGDGQAIVAHLPLTGYERIEFKLYTPGTSRGYDFTSVTGPPMFIYKISNRTPLTPSSQIYVLHFCSREMLRNQRVKVSQSYSSMSTAVRKIFKDPRYLS